MSRKFEDLTGQKFGKLVVLFRTENKIESNGRKRVMWHCKCDCGNETDVRASDLKMGKIKSCGCLKLKQKTRSKKITNCFDTISNDYGIGTTANGEKFYFDKEDLGKITSVSSSWNVNDAGYLEARDMRDCAERYSNGRRQMVKIKDIIMDKQPNEIVKYINPKHKYDNRKSNLIKIKAIGE